MNVSLTEEELKECRRLLKNRIRLLEMKAHTPETEALLSMSQGFMAKIKKAVEDDGR